MKVKKSKIKKEISRLLGQSYPSEPKRFEQMPNPTLLIRKWQPNSTSSSLSQGDRGYVTGMYRVDAVKLDGSDFTDAYKEYLRNNR